MYPAARRRPHWSVPSRSTEDEFDRLFDRMLGWWGDGGREIAETATYPVDIREDEQNIYVEAEMPGFNKDEIDVSLEQGVLNIRAEHRTEPKTEEESGGRTHLRERSYRRIERSFSLPTNVDESDVDARLEGGVLYLTLKKTQAEQPPKIEIK
jgi:HSP20 family protein